MSMTTTKKVVGTIGAILASASAWLLANSATLTALLPPKYANDIAFVAALTGILAAWWGKHWGSSPSVADAVKEGTISQEVARVNASN